jgi:hypothetical protein
MQGGSAKTGPSFCLCKKGRVRNKSREVALVTAQSGNVAFELERGEEIYAVYPALAARGSDPDPDPDLALLQLRVL